MSDMNFGANLLPTEDKGNSLGSSQKHWDNVYADKINGENLNDAVIATQSDIAIIINGNQTTHTGGVAVGEYVIVRNSTISGITDGLYKATQAIPVNTAITSAYLAAVSGGGLNELNSKLTSYLRYIGTTPRISDVSYSAGNHGYSSYQSSFTGYDISKTVVIPKIHELAASKGFQVSGALVGIDGKIYWTYYAPEATTEQGLYFMVFAIE